jgi:hypothetical protein
MSRADKLQKEGKEMRSVGFGDRREADFRDRLGEAFKAMRRAGLIARQAFMCCGNCAGAELATRAGAMPAARRARVKGVAFYTRQDAARLAPARAGEEAGVFIAYGPLETQAAGRVGLATPEVGRLVEQACREAGLEVEWDGSPEKRIYARERPLRWLPWRLGESMADAASLACGGVA